MNIIWFSEIKWSYLKTRKQQILSRFPVKDKIYFIESQHKTLTNHYTPENFHPVYPVTIPQLRSTAIPILRKLLTKKAIRSVIENFSKIWFRLFIKIQSFRPDIIITSNVFSFPLVEICLKTFPGIKVIYDCNDDPLAFPDTPMYKRDYFDKTVAVSDSIVLPGEDYRRIIPGIASGRITIINNGVDFKLFQGSPEKPNLYQKISNPIIVYTGVIAEWFDFDLVNRVVTTLKDFHFVFVGPIAPAVKNQFDKICRNSNVSPVGIVPHEELSKYLIPAVVAMIPFKKNDLTSIISPNKLFEYAAAGKHTVATNFNDGLKKYSHVASIANSPQEFCDHLTKIVANHPDPSKLKSFSEQYDWGGISQTYHDFIQTLVPVRKK